MAGVKACAEIGNVYGATVEEMLVIDGIRLTVIGHAQESIEAKIGQFVKICRAQIVQLVARYGNLEIRDFVVVIRFESELEWVVFLVGFVNVIFDEHEKDSIWGQIRSEKKIFFVNLMLFFTEVNEGLRG